MIELKRFVERVVRPVPSPDVWQKIRMREELYAHLFDAYEHELSLTDDENEAQCRAIARMGDPKVLTADLCSTISWIDRQVYKISEFVTRKSDEPFGGLSWRVATVMTGELSILSIGACLLNINEILAWTNNGQITLRLMAALVLSFSIGSFLLTLLAEMVSSVFAKSSTRRDMVLSASLMTLGAFPIVFSLGIGIHLVTSWNLAELSTASWSSMSPALAGAIIAGAVCIASTLEHRAAAPWLELEIDG